MADYSWGRFWGWDPKETWALITLFVYLIIVHSKNLRKAKDLKLALCSSFAFLFVLMTWFGVNFILGEGLHSYGKVEGGAVILSIIFIAQLLIIILGFSKNRSLPCL